MDIFASLAAGFAVALTPEALMWCFIGVTVGTLVGVLPGIGATATIAICLPLTYYLTPSLAIIMLAGIYYGAQYGSSTASILLNIPGTAASIVTCLDGHPMARQGRAGVALFVTSITSYVGGTIAILLLMFFAPTVAQFALGFTSAEYFAVMLLGLVAASTLAVGSPIKGLTMVVFGLLIGTVGIDFQTGTSRFTFGQSYLYDGMSLVAVAMGLFGVAEILNNMGGDGRSRPRIQKVRLPDMLPTGEETRRIVFPILRGSAIGSLIGVLPGAGTSIASFMAYAVEKRVSKEPERFGHGAIEGIAAPESANNAAAQAAFVPTLSLGIPGDAVMAVLFGALLLHGITPGPQFVTQYPDLFWGLVASFWIGNLILLVLNIPLIGVWVRLLTVPYQVLYPTILFLICIGVFSVRNSMFDLYLAITFGVIGLLMLRLSYPGAPLLLGLILGPMMEDSFRRAMTVSRGSFSIFLERPVSAVLLVLTLGVLLMSLLPSVWRWFAMRLRAREES